MGKGRLSLNQFPWTPERPSEMSPLSLDERPPRASLRLAQGIFPSKLDPIAVAASMGGQLVGRIAKQASAEGVFGSASVAMAVGDVGRLLRHRLLRSRVDTTPGQGPAIRLWSNGFVDARPQVVNVTAPGPSPGGAV